MHDTAYRAICKCPAATGWSNRYQQIGNQLSIAGKFALKILIIEQ
jgi:hypothetical protein